MGREEGGRLFNSPPSFMAWAPAGSDLDQTHKAREGVCVGELATLWIASAQSLTFLIKTWVLVESSGRGLWLTHIKYSLFLHKTQEKNLQNYAGCSSILGSIMKKYTKSQEGTGQ